MKQCDDEDKNVKKDTIGQRREDIIGLGDRSFRKNYYPQLRRNMDRLERFRTLLDHTPDMVMLISLPDGIVSDVNQSVCTLFGVQENQLVNKPLHELPWSRVNDVLDNILSDSNSGSAVIEQKNSAEEWVWLELSYQRATLDNHQFCVIVGRNVTERVEQSETLNTLLSEKNALLDNALVGMVWIKNRIIVACNQRFEQMLGYEEGTVIGQSTRLLYDSEETFNDFGNEAYRVLCNEDSYSATIQLMKANGESVWCELTGNAIDQNNPRKGSIWIFNDINQLKSSEEKAVYMSQHDALTGLPNQRLLSDRLEQAMLQATKQCPSIALLSLDLDNFKIINDLLGYSNANQLLVLVSERLKECVKELGTVCRQGGDEFAILFPNLSDAEKCISRISSIFSALETPFHFEGREINLTVSMGVALFPEDGSDLETLLRKADSAMFQAKEDGKNTYRFYRQQLNESIEEELTIAFGLRKALDDHQFELYYQPKVEIRSGKLKGAEALIRWKHPTLGMISPAKFIPVAEETGLIIPISDWVLHTACAAVGRWRDLGMENALVAVNLSAVHFARGDVSESIHRAINDTGIVPRMLELELTESILIKDPEFVLDVVKDLKEFGCRLSIDDFGTGYSSLAYLKRFPVDILKIDREFVKEIATNQEDEIIVKTIIQMAKGFGIATVAEGVEDQQTLDKLQRFGCDRSQGYFTGRPMPENEFIEFMLNNRREQKNKAPQNSPNDYSI
ncbi:EAL domain-containing protein [Vibrio tritonius]|uniref:EAL domain-containing protein n=1 Tax=Vibrio tritonius TaxID=1435069 RepID=A0ABS7YR95_9VIBR|nr:bifunctional diguanylate cyclase/phosphodiesterase [Vibrio tritonius]MCA2017497.1 EAL domain-containing protein [Vibrio tritonius]